MVVGATLNDRDIYTARLRAVDKMHGFPCLSYTLMSMVPVISDLVPTAATDRWWRVYVNPKFFASIDVDQGAMVMVHEAWHLLSDHFARADRFGIRPSERKIWNYAGDCEINTKDELWRRLPHGCLLPELFGFPDNLLAEEYFKLFKDNPDAMKRPQGEIGDGPATGDCGSCAHGQEDDYELPAPGESDAPGVTKTRAKLIREETARQIIESASKGIGSVPAGWVRWAKRQLVSEVDWRLYLRSSIQGMLTALLGHSVPTFRKLARRQFKYPDFVLPAYQDPVPNVAVIIDTSGSMSDDYVAQGIAEVDGILMTVGRGITVDVFFTDAAASKAQRVSCARNLIPYGGGGTDMREGFKAIEARAKFNATLPSLIVVVTDGLTPWPENPPAYGAQVCVVLVGNGGDAPGWAKPPRHNTVKIQVKKRSSDDNDDE